MRSGDRPMVLPAIFGFLVVFSGILVADGQSLESDGNALLAFRSAVGQSVLPWNASVSPCAWYGVFCDSGRVTELHLPGAGLIGQIPAGSLGAVTELRTVSLRFNALSGTLPADLVALAQLRNLFLQGNGLSGPIPVPLFSLTMLVRLSLSHNAFSGEIPPAFNNLTRLGSLLLQNNNLSGQIPDLALPALVQFNVSDNPLLNGSVPEKLRAMPADAFLNTGICGGPLGACPGEASPAPAAAGPGLPPDSGGVSGSDSRGEKHHKLSGGAIAGIAIGSAFGFLVIASLLVLLLLSRRGSKSDGVRSAEAGGARAKPSEEVEVALREKRSSAAGSENGYHHPPPQAAQAAAPPPAAAAVAAFAGGSSGSGKRLVFFNKGQIAYDLEDLLRASAEVLGKGTCGTTYKAMLEMGAVVAVKRLRDMNLHEKEFKEKVAAIGAMEHPNLVPLEACYYSKDEKLLVFEHMPMGSLSSLLHGNRGSSRTPLDWETRSTIALAAACGIEYIHSLGPGVSHGNIKSSNILLGRSYEARVSDHGLVNLIGPSATPNRATGYRAPEVTDVRKVSQKGDVYSFGVLLLELLTGKAPAHAFLNEEGVDLPRWVQSVVREEWTSEVFDEELLRHPNAQEEMVQLLQLAVDCAAQYPDSRPSMSEVVVRVKEIHTSRLASAGGQTSSRPNLGLG